MIGKLSMNTSIARCLAVALALSTSVSVSAAFAAGKSCDELKTAIATKLDARNVTGYSLDIVDADKAGNAKVVGSCEHGARKITYTKQ